MWENKINVIDLGQEEKAFPMFKEFNVKQKAHGGELRVKTDLRFLR